MIPPFKELTPAFCLRVEGILHLPPARPLVVRVSRRPIVDSIRVEKLLAVADQVETRDRKARRERTPLRTLLRLAGDTGRRISSILALRWSDWRPDLGTNGKLRWRAEEDKVGKEWWSPVTPEVKTELERLRRERPGLGESLLFPGVNDPTRPITVMVAIHWLRQAEKLAKLETLPGGAWHPFRRRWATERKHLSLKDVAVVGGWVETTTLERCYQVPDEATMEQVVTQPKRLKLVG